MCNSCQVVKVGGASWYLYVTWLKTHVGKLDDMPYKYCWHVQEKS